MTAGILKTKTLLICGAIAGPLFVVTLLVEGATRAHYNPLRHPGSSLELGDFGWTQIANFVVAGLLTVAFAVGLRRTLRPGPGSTWGPLLIAVWGIGLIGAGVFATDPVNGYPPGTPEQITQPTWHGLVHDMVFSLPGFASFAVAFFVFTYAFARRDAPGWAIYSAVTGVVFVVDFYLASAAFAQALGLTDFGGLFQRITIAAGWAWLTALALRQLRDRR